MEWTANYAHASISNWIEFTEYPWISKIIIMEFVQRLCISVAFKSDPNCKFSSQILLRFFNKMQILWRCHVGLMLLRHFIKRFDLHVSLLPDVNIFINNLSDSLICPRNLSQSSSYLFIYFLKGKKKKKKDIKMVL